MARTPQQKIEALYLGLAKQRRDHAKEVEGWKRDVRRLESRVEFLEHERAALLAELGVTEYPKPKVVEPPDPVGAAKAQEDADVAGILATPAEFEFRRQETWAKHFIAERDFNRAIRISDTWATPGDVPPDLIPEGWPPGDTPEGFIRKHLRSPDLRSGEPQEEPTGLRAELAKLRERSGQPAEYVGDPE